MGKSYYKLFSVNLLRFIKMHNIKPVSKGVHPVSKKNYWVFELTDELSQILTAWSNNRDQENQKIHQELRVGH